MRADVVVPVPGPRGGPVGFEEGLGRRVEVRVVLGSLEGGSMWTSTCSGDEGTRKKNEDVLECQW